MNRPILVSFLCAMILAAGTGCQNDNTPDDKTVKTRQLTITVNEDSEASEILRAANATITDGGSTLSASWTAGDQLSCCDLSWTAEATPVTGTLTASSTATTSNLTGSIGCSNNDYLAVVYPKVSSFAHVAVASEFSYTFSLTGQDGTLAKLASTYHQQYGRAHVTSVTNNTATAEMDKMQSLLTVCKFSFKDKATEAAIPVKTLTISYGGSGSDANKYPQSGKVTVDVNTTNGEASAEANDVSAPLTITCASAQCEVYVALLPTAVERTYNFTVTNTSGTYTGTASAWLKKGEYVPALGLKLTKQN